MTHPGSQHGWQNRSWPQQSQMGQQAFPQQQPLPPGPPGAYPPQGNFPPPPPPPKKKRTGLIVAMSLVVALLVVGGGVVGAVAVLGKSEPTAQLPQQPGPPPELPIHPGNGVPAQYGDMTPPNACSLLPVDLVTQRGWQIAPKERVTEELPDPYGSVQSPVAQSGKGAAFCKVFFEKDAMLMVSFEGPPFNKPSILDSQIEHVSNSGEAVQEGGWKYLAQLEDGIGTTKSGLVEMTDGNNLVTLSVAPPDKTSPDRALALTKEVVPGVIEKLEKAPEAPNESDYPEPYGKLPDPCKILTADDLASLGTVPSGQIYRQWGAAERVLYKLDRPGDSRYVETSCSRRSLDPAEGAGPPKRSLSLSINTMANDAAARNELGFYADPETEFARRFGPPVQLSFEIGDGHSYYMPEWGGAPAIMFQSGRHLVFVAGTEDLEPLPLEAMVERYESISDKIAERLR